MEHKLGPGNLVLDLEKVDAVYIDDALTSMYSSHYSSAALCYPRSTYLWQLSSHTCLELDAGMPSPRSIAESP